MFDTEKRAFIKRDVYVSDGKICGQLAECETVDCDGKFIVPGYIDIHTHGCGGVDIMEADKKALEKLSGIYALHGTTTKYKIDGNGWRTLCGSSYRGSLYQRKKARLSRCFPHKKTR